jgi:hypothetical protein
VSVTYSYEINFVCEKIRSVDRHTKWLVPRSISSSSSSSSSSIVVVEIEQVVPLWSLMTRRSL